MRRRSVLQTLAAWPLLVAAQRVRAQAPVAARLPRAGIIYWGPREHAEVHFAPHLIQALAAFGRVKGRNLELEWRYADGDVRRVEGLAAELGALQVEAIVTAGAERTAMVRRALPAVAIIALLDDPVGLGLAATLARPGGTVTGLTIELEDMAGKQFELLRRLMPRLSHVALLLDAQTSTPDKRAAPVARAARTLGIATEIHVVDGLPGFERAFERLRSQEARAAFILNFRTTTDGRRLAALAIKHRVATMSLARGFVEYGGLMAYFLKEVEMARRLAAQLEKVLRGTKPADIPFEKPARFDFVINRQTAREIGLEIPADVLLRADEVIG